MKSYSSAWKSSKKPRKQRKYRAKAPLHIKDKYCSVHLIKELREKHKKRSMRVRSGDKVKILRGDYKGHIGKVEKVSIKMTKIYVQGIEIQKKDGTKVQRGFDPSNLIITELILGDKKRNVIIQRKK